MRTAAHKADHVHRHACQSTRSNCNIARLCALLRRARPRAPCMQVGIPAASAAHCLRHALLPYMQGRTTDDARIMSRMHDAKGIRVLTWQGLIAFIIAVAPKVIVIVALALSCRLAAMLASRLRLGRTLLARCRFSTLQEHNIMFNNIKFTLCRVFVSCRWSAASEILNNNQCACSLETKR